jgi:capsular exopolysaccharide synthesis family protein
MDIRKIFSIIIRWIWLLVLGAVIAGGYGFYTSSRQTPMYRATTRFVVLRAATTGYYDYYSYIDYQQLIATYTQLLTTDKLLEQVSQEVGFQVYEGQASAEQIGETQFVRLSVDYNDPEKAAIVANTLVSVLIDQNEQLQSVRYETTEQNLQARANDALSQIEILQNEIDNISESTLQQQIAEVTAQIDILQAQVTDLEIDISEIDPLIATDQQRSQLIQYQAELNRVQPVLDLYQELYTQLVVLGEPIQNENISSTQIDRVQRTLSLYEQIYFTSISSLEELNLTRVQSAPNVVQVEPATPPSRPYAPRPVQTTLLYASIGLFAMAGVAFLIEYLDDTIKTPEDVKNVLGLPVIGLVADMKGGKEEEPNKRRVFVADQPRSPITEAFRSLRTSLDFYSVDEPLRILIVTSPGPEEGKTTVATNLAAILAKSNKRVLLLDADMRRPNVHNHLDISNRVGLSDLIRGRLEIDDVIQVSEKIENLNVVTSGSLPPNPAELIASQRMTDLLKNLVAKFDMIVIDTPPAIVTDAQILATKADGVIYVLKAGKTRSLNAQKPLEEFDRVGAQVIGVVMNRIPRNRDYYYGGFSYYAPNSQVGDKYYRTNERILPEDSSGSDSTKQAEPRTETGSGSSS